MKKKNAAVHFDTQFSHVFVFPRFSELHLIQLFPLQADTTDTEYKEADGGTHQEVMDLLEYPEVRQRAQSIASVITSTMEGRWAWSTQSRVKVEK